MNQVHKVIWSRVKNCYIVVSEITKRVGRDNKASVTEIRPLRALLCAMVIAGCMLPADADAASGIVWGTGASAPGQDSVAVGTNAKAKKSHAVAQGTEAKADGVYALAFGYKVQTLANYAIAMGHQAKAGANAIGGVAIGSSSVVEGEHGVALGDQAESKNKQTIAVGLKSVSSGEQSISIGHQAKAIGNNSIAEGVGAKGYAKDGVAIGNNAESGTADNKDPRIPTIPSNNGVAVGNSAKASGGSSVSVGNDSIGNGPSSVAIGNAATANDVRTTAIGNNAHAEGAGSLSIGREASALTLENATSTNPLVTGTDEQLDRKGVMAIGDDAKASGNNSIALGTSAKAGDLEKTRNADSVTLTGSAKRITKLTTKRSVNNAVAIGTESSVQSDEDIAVGYRATTVASKYHQLPGSGQVAIGSNSNTYGSRGDVAIGSGAETNIRVKNVDHTNGPTEKRDAQSVAIGSVAKAYGSQAVAVGADTRAIGNSSVAIGTDDIELDRAKLQSLLPGLANNENLNNKAPSDATLGSAALHDKPYYVKTASIGTASVALGAMSQAAGDASMAMGLNALAEGDASTAIGPLARSKGKKSIAMGVNANSQVDGGVALGADSVSNRQQTSNAYIPSGADTAQVNAINATKGTTGAVSVGSDTVKRQIINVAAGTDDSDAVNVAQLKAVTSNASWTVQGNGSDVNAVKNGSKVNFADGTNTTASVTKDASGKVTAVKYNLKKDVNLGTDGSLTINGKTYVNKDGLNANSQKITNVATGTAGTDAVNVDQLNAAIAGTAKATTVKAKDANVTVTEGTNPAGGKEYTVGLGDKVTLGTADKKIVVDGTSGKITAGSKVTIDGTTGDIQAGTVKVTGAGTVNELTNRTWDIDNPTVVHGQAATEDQLKTVSDGVKTNKTNITNINNTIGKGLNFGGDSGAVINKKLGEKLEIKGGASADLTDDNIGVVSDGTKLNVKLKKDVNLGPDGSLTINGKTYVNKDGLNANSQKITNVADGTVNSDAVNFGQLKDAVAAGKTILKDGKNTTVEGEGTVANPYKVNVNDDLVLGKKGADGKDGSIGVNGKDGSSVVIHGKDGISIKGKDGKDGVTLKAKDGANGTEGQIGLTGPAGKDGKSTHADIGVNAGPASLDPAKNLSATEMTRLYYVDEKGDHQVATMDDGMKFAGNTGLAIKKLNSTMTIRGTGTKADTEYDPSNIKTMVDADGNMIVGLDKNLKADSVGINGKDGRDGATIKGGDGKPGVDGTNITRLIIEEKNGKQHDIATLDDGMKYGGDTGAVIKKKLNEQVNVVGGITDESKLTTDDNIGVVSDGSNNLKVRLAKDVKLNSVTAGNVVMDTTGFYVKKMTRTPAGTVSLTADGLNNGGNKIANIAAGEADTDAVNVSQLKNQGSEIVNKGFGIKAEDGNEVKKKLGETVDVVGDGKNISTRVEGGRVRVGLKDDILLNSVTTGRTRMDTNGLTVQDGSGNTAVTVDKDGLKIKDGPSVTKSGIDAGGKKITNVAAGEADTDAVNVSQLKKAAAGATTKVADGKNTTVTSETNADGSKTYHVNLNDDITLGTDPSKQISIKGTEGTIKAGQVTVNGTAGTVNGLTNKTWDPNNITSGQAATEDQLKVVSGQAGKHSSVTAGSNISVTTGTNANGGTEYKVAVVDTPTFKTVTTGNTVMSNSGLTIKNGPSITQTGVDAGGKRITNVAAGKADTDAVNVGQLKQIGGAINKVDNRINRVGAGAAALAALHPLDFDPDDKWDFTLGYGNYKDAHSLALGAFYRPNEDTMISVGGSIGGGENMVNAGLSMKLGQGNHVSTSKVAMAKEIKDLRAELENVKGALLKVADGRPLDSMDMDKMQLFPDVPENHWAYDYVATLAGNGVIVGYPDGQFGGDRMMTRYEMAALIYRAMQNGAAADDRMARALKEFEPELERIRVDTISKHKDGTPDIQRVRVIKGRG